MKKYWPDFSEENVLWKKGHASVVGLDEVGRGSFAGPVVVGAVVFQPNATPILGINDSKLLSPKRREELTIQIKKQAKAYAVAEIGLPAINKLGIGKATQMAFRKAIKLLTIRTDFLLIDAFYVEHFRRKYQKPIIKGDQKSISIAAASIIAKVHRDALMVKLHEKYPDYGFDIHKGYGTLKHREAIKKYGLCRIHRKSFKITQ